MEMRMRICKFSISILLVLALLSPGLLASGFENSGIGLKARGMSGAFSAIADDWTAAYYNPAGYAFIYDNQWGANFAFVHYRNELTPNYNWPGEDDWDQPGIYNGLNIYNIHEILSNPSVGFVARVPLFGETVFGLSGFQPFDNNISWKLYEHDLAYNDSLSLPVNQFRNNLDVVAFQLTLAKEYLDGKLGIGLGLQLLRADLNQDNTIFRDNPFYDNLPSQLQTLLMKKVTEFNHNDGNGYGFGFKLGTLYKVNESVNLAFNLNVPLDIDISGISELEYHMPKVPSLSSDSVQITNPGPGNLFVAGSRIIDTADFDATLNLPVSFGGGVSYQMNEKLKIAIDAEITLWDSFDGLTFAFSDHRGLPTSADTSDIVRDFMTSDLAYPVKWDNTFKIMAGFDYSYTDYLTIIGGSIFDQSPIRSTQQTTPLFTDTGNKLGISGGFIFHIQQWDLGIISSYTKYDDLNVSSLTDFDDDGNVDNFAGDYKSKTYETVLSFNYRF